MSRFSARISLQRARPSYFTRWLHLDLTGTPILTFLIYLLFLSIKQMILLFLWSFRPKKKKKNLGVISLSLSPLLSQYHRSSPHYPQSVPVWSFSIPKVIAIVYTLTTSYLDYCIYFLIDLMAFFLITQVSFPHSIRDICVNFASLNTSLLSLKYSSGWLQSWRWNSSIWLSKYIKLYSGNWKDRTKTSICPRIA